MVGQEPLSPGVKVFMTKEEALWHEMECGDSQQGNSSKGALFTAVQSAREFTQIGASLSGRQVREEEFDSKEIEVVYSKKDLDNVEPEVSQGNVGVEPIEESHPGEGILLKKPKS